MFIQSCLIRKNTKELVDKIERLGYDYAENGAGAWFIPLCELNYLAVNLYSKGYYMGVNGKWDDSCYDCGTNEDLFLAMAALRDDSDKYQWFTNKKGDFNKSFSNEFLHFKFDDKDIGKIADAIINKTDIPISGKPLEPIDDTQDWHKATVQELIEYFKNK